ncbi:MAG: peptidoglycan-associated lipoprotein Pal [Bdellovibrionales bacterium]
MLKRVLLMCAVVVLVGACSSTEEEATLDTQGVGQQEQLATGGPLDDVYGTDQSYHGSAVPGSQEDFTVNVGDRIFFGTDRYDISSEARYTLEKQANWLAQYPNLNITVEGHADERGTREYNLALGERRANSVKNYLVALGVDPRRVDTVTYGKERPAVPGANETAWAQNRRGVSKIN